MSGPLIANQRIRLKVDCSQMGSLQDAITGAAPQHWNGVDIQYEIAFFYGEALAAIDNFDQVIVELKAADPRTGLPLYNVSVSSADLNQGLILSDWLAGEPADCHCLAAFSNTQTNLDLNDDTVTFWLVISALTSDAPAHKIVLGATPLNVVEGGEGVTPPASVVPPTYYTAAQSDARFARTVDLTSINNHLGTLDTEMTAVTTTANGALQRTGGTITGSLTLTGLSGVLKTTAGLVAGGATTSDLPEGSRLYWTQARFNTAIAAISGVASGVCPLDSGGLVPAANLPSITVHDTFVVSSQAAMLALAAHQGDVAIRTDLSETFILVSGSPATLGNWAQLLSPTAAVASVNGLVGTVVLTSANISEVTNLYYTTARVHTDSLTSTLTAFSSASGGSITSSDTILSALGKTENRLALNDAKVTGSDRVLKAGDTMTGALQFSGTTNPGIVLNSLTSTQRGALTAANGMIVYDSTLAQIMAYTGTWSPLSLGGTGTTWFAEPLNGATPDAGLGQPGNWLLDTVTGEIWQNNLVIGVPTWQLIFSPAVSGFLSLGGGTMSGGLSFSGTGNPGLRLNNVTTTQQNALTVGAGGTVFNTTLTTPSYYNGSAWIPINVTYLGGNLQYNGGSGLTNVPLAGVRNVPVTKTTSYVMATADSMVVTTTAGITITLPAAPGSGYIYFVMAAVGGAVTVNTGTAALIYDSTNASASSNTLTTACYGYMFDGVKWWVVSNS